MGARSLLRAEKKKFKSSVWWVRDCYYDQKKKSSSGCAITTISTTGPVYAKSSNFYSKLYVSNLNVTNLYLLYLIIDLIHFEHPIIISSV